MDSVPPTVLDESHAPPHELRDERPRIRSALPSPPPSSEVAAPCFSPTEVNMRAFMLRTLSPMDSIGSTAIARVLDNLTGASRGTLSTPVSDWHR